MPTPLLLPKPQSAAEVRAVGWEIQVAIAVVWLAAATSSAADLVRGISGPSAPFALLMVYTLAAAVGMGALSVWLVLRSGDPPALHGIVRARWHDVLLALGVVVLWHLLWQITWPAAEHVFETSEEIDRRILAAFGTPSTTLDRCLLVVSSLANGFGEEMFYRGYLVPRLARRFQVWTPAVLISALLFGIVHLYQGLGTAIQHTAHAVVLGVVFVLWRRIWPFALAHAYLDVSALW